MGNPKASVRDSRDPNQGPRYKVRLPGFLRDEQEVGLGDVMKRAGSLVGITPCSGCTRRAETMNGWLAFGGSRRSGHRSSDYYGS
jgi:hypothetical protein